MCLLNFTLQSLSGLSTELRSSTPEIIKGFIGGDKRVQTNRGGIRGGGFLYCKVLEIFGLIHVIYSNACAWILKEHSYLIVDTFLFIIKKCLGRKKI